MAQKLLVNLQPIGRRVEVDAGTNLLQAAQRAGVEIVASCGGVGICSTCKMRVMEGRVTPPTLTEEEELGKDLLNAGYRLACQTEPLENVRVEIPRESLVAGQRVQVDGREGQITFDPAVVAVDLALTPPTLEDLRADMTRVNQELARLGYAPLIGDLALIGELSLFLRRSDWRARIAIRPEAQGSELVSVLPYGQQIAGLAMDIGSTKLAIFLLDLQDGAILYQGGVMNPQISFGEDVVSRIAHANKGDAERKQLQERLVDVINQTLDDLCAKEGMSREQIVDVVAVGNTAIHHFFTGLPVEQLGEAPYTPVVADSLNFPAAQIGLRVAAGARVYLPPNIAGYVGADHVSALIATRSYINNQHTSLLVDIGTNTEISLIHNGRVLSCSCASGPAFEGAHIRDGMRAAPGAIERIHIDADSVRPVTIGGQPAVGICGSGILNAVAEMLDARVLNDRGVLNAKDGRVRQVNGKSEFLLVPAQETGHERDIVVTRKDVNELQLAKSAIRGGLEILMKEAGIEVETVNDFIVAGAFGTYLDLGSALRVGMFPRLPMERFHQVGNAAGVGARQMLLSRVVRQEAERIVGGVEYVELTTYPRFHDVFIECMYFDRKDVV
jgi:uncharacterized 2Fe-2S/4Fe-4S cluster protein (DUF4445 family)